MVSNVAAMKPDHSAVECATGAFSKSGERFKPLPANPNFAVVKFQIANKVTALLADL